MLIWDMPLLVRQFMADRQGFEDLSYKTPYFLVYMDITHR